MYHSSTLTPSPAASEQIRIYEVNSVVWVQRSGAWWLGRILDVPEFKGKLEAEERDLLPLQAGEFPIHFLDLDGCVGKAVYSNMRDFPDNLDCARTHHQRDFALIAAQWIRDHGLPRQQKLLLDLEISQQFDELTALQKKRLKSSKTNLLHGVKEEDVLQDTSRNTNPINNSTESEVVELSIIPDQISKITLSLSSNVHFTDTSNNQPSQESATFTSPHQHNHRSFARIKQPNRKRPNNVKEEEQIVEFRECDAWCAQCICDALEENIKALARKHNEEEHLIEDLNHKMKNTAFHPYEALNAMLQRDIAVLIDGSNTITRKVDALTRQQYEIIIGLIKLPRAQHARKCSDCTIKLNQ